MKKLLFFIIVNLLLLQGVFAQVAIKDDGSSADSSSALDVQFSDKGFLLPHMTYDQRNAIEDPAEGLMVYCTNCGLNGSGRICIYSNGIWSNVNPCISETPAGATPVYSLGQVIWKWNPVSGAAGYRWNSIDSYDSSEDMGTDTSKTETVSGCDTIYSRYVWSYGGCGISTPDTLILDLAIAPPAEAEHASGSTQITWKWHPVANALGYKWNTVNDYDNAEDVGADTMKVETGLACLTTYTRYVWAYIICGPSQLTVVSDTTTWCCGLPVTVVHTAGDVAPVNKTVIYSTVTNVPGEASKCWITCNLGADHQATAVNDATEPSAGWYWQFNLRQGYKYSGSTRTPNTPWITSIDTISQWLTDNDPCRIELEGTWRIPTYTEFFNIDNAGGWITWTEPWNSLLKLHAAGVLWNTTGQLYFRGADGWYWSNTHNSTNTGHFLTFRVDYCNPGATDKAKAQTIRCVR